MRFSTKGNKDAKNIRKQDTKESPSARSNQVFDVLCEQLQ